MRIWILLVLLCLPVTAWAEAPQCNDDNRPPPGSTWDFNATAHIYQLKNFYNTWFNPYADLQNLLEVMSPTVQASSLASWIYTWENRQTYTEEELHFAYGIGLAAQRIDVQERVMVHGISVHELSGYRVYATKGWMYWKDVWQFNSGGIMDSYPESYCDQEIEITVYDSGWGIEFENSDIAPSDNLMIWEMSDWGTSYGDHSSSQLRGIVTVEECNGECD